MCDRPCFILRRLRLDYDACAWTMTLAPETEDLRFDTAKFWKLEKECQFDTTKFWKLGKECQFDTTVFESLEKECQFDTRRKSIKLMNFR